MNLLSEKNIDTIKDEYGQDAWIKTIQLEYESLRYFNRTKDLVEHDRIGEVVFAVERPNHKFITVRSKEYPKGIFRIPTGGIGHGEDIIEAVKREVLEELGVKTRIVRFIGVYRIQIAHGKESFWFYSFFFHLEEISGSLLTDATDDEVSEIFEADSKGLADISESLKNIEREWKDWGSFRFLTTGTVADYVKKLSRDSIVP